MSKKWISAITLLSILSFLLVTSVTAFADDNDIGNIEHVIGPDNRTRVTNTTKVPNAQTVKIYADYGWKNEGIAWYAVKQ